MEAIVTQDTAALSKISGIGKKTAERMVLELKDKLFDESQPSVATGAPESEVNDEEAFRHSRLLVFSKKDAEQR
jgi:holliday junction DNA helicase RuvA